MASLPTGTLLHSRYRVLRLIGEGASGAVYLARDTRERGLIWAVKEMPAADDDEMVSIFHNEARMLQALSHPAIPVLEDFFTERTSLYLVMERVEGPTLEAVLARSPRGLAEADVLDWGIQVCDVLAYLHGRTPPVLYRDLKPSNCMLTAGGRIRIVDLGISRVLNPVRPLDTQAFGTPGFCPPEQYAGRTVPASDLYALGATMLVLLTGLDVERASLPLPRARSLNPAVSRSCDVALRRALQLDPDERYASAREMHDALERVRGEGRGRRTWRRWWPRASASPE